MIAQAQAPLLHASTSGVSFWELWGVIGLPYLAGILGTVVFIRYLRSAYGLGKGYSDPLMAKRALFRATMLWGALFGVLGQVTFSGTVYLTTGVLADWRGMVGAVAFTGLGALVAYEAFRAFCTWRYDGGKRPIWAAVFNWISARDGGKSSPSDDDGSLTRIMSEDKTDPKGAP